MKNANAKNEELKNTIIAALEDLKAVDITVISVADSSSVTDWMVIATGTSNRHVKALASNVEVDGKKYGFKTIGSEGNETAEWVLVDFGDAYTGPDFFPDRDDRKGWVPVEPYTSTEWTASGSSAGTGLLNTRERCYPSSLPGPGQRGKYRARRSEEC